MKANKFKIFFLIEKYIFLIIFFVYMNVYSQAPGCPNVIVGENNTGGDATITCVSNNCVDLSALYLNVGATTSYTVSSIAYSPPFSYTGLANPISVGTDDIWSPVVNLPFDFCFYGGIYNQCLISSNGAITFDLINNTAGSGSAWSFNDTLPNSNLFLTSIFGIYHDMDPSLGGEIAWELLGSTPCRTLVVSFNEVSLYNCTSSKSTFQVVLYETTNVIEVYVQEKPACSSWNNGNSLIGVQNASGTTGIAPPNRNTGNWNISSALPEAWRFTPSGADISTITWYDAITGGTNLGNTNSINVCPTTTTTYRAEVEYSSCDGSTVLETDTVTISVDDCPTTIDFDGVDDYVSVQPIMGGYTAVSQMGWVNLDTSYTGEGTFMGQSNNRLCVNTDKTIRATVKTTSGTYIVNTTETITTGQWIHLASIYNGSTIKIYINGEEKASLSVGGTALASSSTDYTLGKNVEDNDKHVDAFLQEVRVFDIALTETQLRAQVYQPIVDNGVSVKGAVLGNDISGLVWSDLVLYLKLISVGTGTTSDDSVTSGTALLYNMTTMQELTAPIPYVAVDDGDWTSLGTWENGNVWDITSLPNKDWAIVQITNNAKVTTTASHTHLGLLIDSGSELEIQNDQLLQNTKYLRLDGQIDLVGESQLIQTTSSDLDVASAGYLERDQQGHSSIYNYNFWSSPVNPMNTSGNNTDYSVAEILKDGTTTITPQTITFNTTGYDGASGGPITLADYWMFKYVNQPDLYDNWMNGHVRSTGTIKVGEGYTQKGTGAATATQNYVFTGKPNNGTIQHTIDANNVYLVGNPYASALDANQFINDNLVSIENTGDVIGIGASTGALYFWEHFSTNNSHVFAAYEGGYATYNLAGGVMAVPDIDVSSNGTGSVRPGRYIPVGQGFFVQGSPSGGTIEFNNGQRAYKRESVTTDDSVFTKMTSVTVLNNNNASEIQRVYFKFATPEGPQRELLLAVKEGMVDGVNYGYDAILIDNQVSDCSFKEGDTLLVIQTIGEIYEGLELPLEVKVGVSGECRFSVEDLSEISEGLNVYFHDKEMNTYTQLDTEAEASFTLETGLYENRFYVVFSQGEILHVDEELLDVESLVIFYNSDANQIQLQNKLEFKVNEIKLYTILGQEIVLQEQQYCDEVIKINLPGKLSVGTYIVKFLYNNEIEIIKKIIIK